MLAAGMLGLGTVWVSLRTQSTFGRAVGDAACPAQPPDWHASAFPELPARRLMPALHAVVYNLHSGLGANWRLLRARSDVERDLRAIARHIAAAAPATEPVDLVGLNEADFGSRRSAWVDQPALVAAELKALTGVAYRVIRAETWRRDVPGLEVRFGNALLVRHPVLAERSCLLGATCTPGASYGDRDLDGWPGEPRGLVRVRVDVYGQALDVLLTHLESFVLPQRESQAAEILRMIGQPGQPPALLLGDMNAVPSTQTHARPMYAADRTHDILTSGALIDARTARAAARGAGDVGNWSTYPARAPQWPLDAVLATPALAPSAIRVIGGLESDHRGLAVVYRWLDEEAAARLRHWHDEIRRRQLTRIIACDFADPEPGWLARAAALRAGTGFFDLSSLPRIRQASAISR